jgi:putative phosphoesterase
MTYLAVLADIHGNLPALQAVLADLEGLQLDGVIVAGDTTGGPHQRECLNLLRGLGAWMIRGNGENYFVDLARGEAPEGWLSSPQWATLRWFYQQLDVASLTFIASLPEQRVVQLPGTAPIRVVHGSLNSVDEHLIPEQDPASVRAFREAGLYRSKAPAINLKAHVSSLAEPVMVCGHSHIPWQETVDGRLLFNPGSVGASISGDARAHYALLTWADEGWRLEPRAVSYDLSVLSAVFEESGLLEEGGAFARACLRNMQTGLNFPGFFMAYVRQLARESGCDGESVVPDDVWQRAVATFDWEHPHPFPAI